MIKKIKKESAFDIKAKFAVNLLMTKGIEEYTLFVVNWASVYKFHWMMFAFQKSLLKEIKNQKTKMRLANEI